MSQQEGMIQDPNGQDIPGNYYHQENDLTGGLPINLDSLRDGPPGTKPFYPYSTLIRYAIKGSPNQKLLLEDIYYAIESRFPYFRTAPSGWKNSVRHNLSLNPCFEKVPRPLTDRGKGSYWTVNDNVDPRTGVHRIRKKKTKGTKVRASEEPDGDYRPPEEAYAEPQPQFVTTPPISEEAGSSRQQPSQQPIAYPYPPVAFDPNFPMMSGMRYPPPPGIISPAEFALDESGDINWRLAWHKEIGHLQSITAEQEKAGVDSEWYKMMFFRLRSVAYPYPEMIHAMASQMPAPPQPPTGEIPQQQQPVQP